MSTEYDFRRLAVPEVKRLSRLSPWKTAWVFTFQWALILTLVWIYHIHPSWFFYALTAFIIAARQHALVILMHEGVHNRLSKDSRINDFLSDGLAAFPVFMKTSVYRRHHMKHHNHLNSEQDPDWARKSKMVEWQFPMSTQSFFNLYKKYLWGFGIIENLNLFRYLSGVHKNSPYSKVEDSRLPQLVFYFLVALTLTYFHLWKEFALFWLVPLFTVFPFIMRLRSIAEHFGLSHETELSQSRNVRASWWERFLIVPYYASYHLDHHLFPSVPAYRLKELNTLLSQYPDYEKFSHQTSSYLIFGESPLLKEISRSP